MHGYIPVTAAELLLLDRPFVQRLRYIRQSSAAHFVFPGMNVHRFEHSIGAMHVASRMFRSTLANLESGASAEAGLRDRIVKAACDVVGTGILSDEADQQREGWLYRCEVGLRRQGLRGGAAETVRKRVALMVIEQALRFGSLLHDVGHLPFSHDFESVLREFFGANQEACDRWPNLAREATGPDPLHERVGRELADWATTQLGHQFDEGVQPPFPSTLIWRQAITIAKEILATRAKGLPPSTDSEQLYRWLFELISGEIDADRCDYVLRDASHYGIPGATFDLDRLVAGMTVYEHDVGASSQSVWRVGLLPRAVSAAEEFLTARSRLYGWAVYHHKSQQISVSLRRALTRQLEGTRGHDLPHPVVGFLTCYDAVLNPQEFSSQSVPPIARFDDMWWLELLKGSLTFGGDSASEESDDLLTALYRSPGRVSLWKKPSDFASLEELEELNGLRSRDTASTKQWQAVRDRLRAELGVELCTFSFAPYEPAITAAGELEGDGPESALTVIRPGSDGATCEPLTRLSPAVRSLWKVWQGSIQVLAFARRNDPPSRDEVLDVIRSGMQGPASGGE